MSTTAAEFRKMFPLYAPDMKREVISLVVKIMDQETPEQDRAYLSKMYEEKLAELKRQQPGVKFDVRSEKGRLIIV